MDMSAFKYLEVYLSESDTLIENVNSSEFIQTENLPKGIKSKVSNLITVIYFGLLFFGIVMLTTVDTDNVKYLLVFPTYIILSMGIFYLLLTLLDRKVIQNKVRLCASIINFYILADNHYVVKEIKKKYPLAYNYVYSESNNYRKEVITVKID